MAGKERPRTCREGGGAGHVRVKGATVLLQGGGGGRTMTTMVAAEVEVEAEVQPSAAPSSPTSRPTSPPTDRVASLLFVLKVANEHNAKDI
mmetsp:Transcript_17005/g.49137  ORF Transcript_17005/g.49137 Transcript_17005/m.49137 type:complete len:91 (+) Transcript_17005:512-784(+)